MRHSPSGYRLFAMALTLPFVLYAAPLAAQRGTPVSTPTRQAMEPVITVGSADELRQDEDLAKDEELDASRALDQARTNKSQAEARIEIAKSELETLKKRLALARKEKREGDRLEMERQKGAQEVRLRLLERSREVRNDEITVQEARRDVARAAQKVVVAERLLVERRSALAAADTLAPLSQLGEDVRQATKTAIERRQDVAEARKRLAERERSLAGKQLKLLDAQRAVRSLGE